MSFGTKLRYFIEPNLSLATERVLLWISLDLVLGVHSTSLVFSTYDQFDLWPGVQNIFCP